MKRKKATNRLNNRGMSLLLVVTACFACIAVGLGGYFVPTSVSIKYKHIYSDDVKKEIDVFVKNYISKANFLCLDLNLFYKNLKEKFKVVKSIDWNWDSLGHASVTIVGVRPLLRVNNKFVLGNKRRLFPYSLFSNATVDELSPFNVSCNKKSYEKLPLQVCEFVKNVPERCWSSYTISYSSQNYSFLKNRKSEACEKYVIVNDKTFQNPRKMKVACFVHDDFINNKQRKRVAYDLRFKNRVYAKVIRNRAMGG